MEEENAKLVDRRHSGFAMANILIWCGVTSKGIVILQRKNKN